ncbi:hypothetical protein FisN_5Hh353 [Fistulifera solaris]|uniref:PUM-HD domain-containing protein n=1 Tax=Fistulifera solaris TaxID=1519565 RepID=A0A1Z5JSG8_FISSO|nr:hypothetical protein FisN_5Hh353 [Fistulifera solaris]|eukprot:GAX16974.1 hypothetical protein FisN_5Hh353 [Fistulifera solaris]
MEQGWNAHDTYADKSGAATREARGQSSLIMGQHFLERCTSAPLPSSSSEKYKSLTGDMLVGNDLLEHMSRGYFDNSHSQTATPVISNGSRLHDSQKAMPADFMLGAGDDSTTIPAVTMSSSFGLSRPLSANSRGDSDVLNRSGEFDEHSPFDFNRLGSNLTRSRSAQPSSMNEQSMFRPPPGLGSTTGQQSPGSDVYNTSSTIGRGLQRPASTGVLSGRHDSILRPASKTLMDLIQEDFPEDNQRSAHRHVGGKERFERLSSSPAIARPSSNHRFSGSLGLDGEPSAEHDYDRYDVEKISYEREGNRGTSQIASPSLHTQPIGNVIHQRSPIDHQQHSKGAAQTTAMHQHFPNIQQQLGQRPLVMEHQLYGQTEQTMQQVVTQHHLGGPNPTLYSHHSQQQRIDPTLPMHHPTLQTAQTVYVGAPGTQPPYGYTTIQYQSSSGPQTHIAQQPVSNAFSGRGDQYVSIVPLQGNGHQLAYWQGDPGQPLGHALAFVNAPGSVAAPIALSRIDGMHQNNHNYGGGRQGRGDKGGRGRRGQQARRGDSSKSGGHSYSSPILEEFRSSKSRDWTLRRIEGYVLEFCQDQNGSRFIQQRLELGDPVEQQIVMKEVLPAIRRLRNDVFGNYVVQKLLDFGTTEMKADIRKTLEGEMLQLSLQMYGCRVVQKSLETLEEEDLPHIMLEFHHNVLSCIHDQNGNHVIQKCIEVMNSRAKKWEAAGDPDRAFFLREQIDFIVNDVLVNTASLSCHPYGCRVLQRILEHCDDHRKEMVLDEIKKNHQKLLDDQYGNYVIQHVLQFGRDSDRDSILHIVQAAGLLGLSRQKFASNVVEKLLKHGNGSQRRAIAREMLHIVQENSAIEPNDVGKSVAILMVRDAYANYVVQTTLDVVPESEEKTLLLEELLSHSDDLVSDKTAVLESRLSN